jgi:hypothetical protein
MLGWASVEPLLLGIAVLRRAWAITRRFWALRHPVTVTKLVTKPFKGLRQTATGVATK